MSSTELEIELAQAREELNRARQSLAAFASAANHDLNAPLRHIGMFAELVRREQGDRLSGPASDYLDRIQGSVDRSERLVDALVEYARLASTAAAHELVDLGVMAQTAAGPFRDVIEEAGGYVGIGSLPKALGDTALLERVFTALIDNAVKFRGEAPPVIRVEPEAAQVGRVAVRLSDDGPGIPPEHGEAAFELLRRLSGTDQVAGEGMGLALCRQLLEMMGGTITYHGEDGRGAAFVITLPACP